MPWRQFVHGDAVPGGQVGDGGRVHAAHGQPAVAFGGDGRAVRGEQPGELTWARRPHQHVPARIGLR